MCAIDLLELEFTSPTATPWALGRALEPAILFERVRIQTRVYNDQIIAVVPQPAANMYII